MYISISAYTDSRKLIKAIRRFYNTFDSFQKEIESLGIKDTTYDGIIISLVDEDEDYFKETPNKDTGICSVINSDNNTSSLTAVLICLKLSLSKVLASAFTISGLKSESTT